MLYYVDAKRGKIMKFIELGLSKSLLNAINKQNYVETTQIQELAIPYILKGKDIIGIAQTGTGKTAAFSLPILERLIQENEPDRKIKVLVLSPTRELALQIRDNIRDFGSETNFKCSVILGGVNQGSQIEVLKKGVDILVATPGRLLDLVKSKKADLNNVSMLVLDEADTMLDLGFIRDVRQIIAKTPSTRQTMLFSATMSNEIKEITNEFLKDPVMVKANVEMSAPKIKQLIYMVDKKNKSNLLFDLLRKEDIKSALIFTRTKHGANKLEEQFEERNIKCSVIHGNKSQPKRVKALSDFKDGETNILIATDIAARGIDIDSLSHVINYDMPEHPEVYVHRIGRTARAGLSGTSISLCCIDEMSHLKNIEKLIKLDIHKVDHNFPMAVFEPSPKKETNNRNNNSRKSNTRDNKKSDSRGYNTSIKENNSNKRYSKTKPKKVKDSNKDGIKKEFGSRNFVKSNSSGNHKSGFGNKKNGNSSSGNHKVDYRRQRRG